MPSTLHENIFDLLLHYGIVIRGWVSELRAPRAVDIVSVL